MSTVLCLNALINTPVTHLFQRIRSTVDEKEQRQLLMDLDVVMRSSDCPYIVKFYGALFTEVTLLLVTTVSRQLLKDAL